LEQQNQALRYTKDQLITANRLVESATPLEVFESYKVEIWGKIQVLENQKATFEETE